MLASGRTPGVKFTKKWLAKIAKMENGVDVEPVNPDITISEEYPLDEYGIPGKVIPTPGHTAGSLTVIVDRKNAIVGDIAMKFPLLSRRSYEPIVAHDMDQVYKSWQKIIDEGVETIYPAHGKIVDAKVLKALIEKRNAK